MRSGSPFLLPHGSRPRTVLAYDLGYVIERPLGRPSVTPDGELVLSVRWCAPSTGEATTRSATRRSRRRADPRARMSEPEIRQRVAAYARGGVRPRGLLATQYSSRTAVDGRWGMPGGGTRRRGGARAMPWCGRCTRRPPSRSSSVRWSPSRPRTGSAAARRGRAEDFHAVRLVYRATCAGAGRAAGARRRGHHGRRPLGGAGPDWRSLTWTVNWREALEQLLPR